MRAPLSVLSLLLAAACAVPPPPGSPVPDPTHDTCEAGALAGLVGQDATTLERVLLMRQVRVIRPGMAVTMDFRPERINFEIDGRGRIARIYCG